VMERIAQSVPAFAGISYHRLAQVTEQWPLIGRADLYYGGTSYENKQGLGVQLPLVGMPVLSWPTLPAEASAGAPGLLGVPITRLYDRGLTVSSSLLLQQRIGEPTVLLHPADALAAGAVDGAEIEVQLNSESYGARAQLSEAVPPGVVLVPRSMGIPISQPAPLAIRAAVLEDRETP
jgi:NADH-quinone oxidoreductase subunit G